MDSASQAVASLLHGHSTLDHHQWTEVIAPPLSARDHARFQSALDELVGLHPDGGHLLQLAWNPHTEFWDSALREYRPYLLWKKEFQGLIRYDGVDQRRTINIGVPRYLILGRTPVEQQTQTADRVYSERSSEAWVEVAPGQYEHDYTTDVIEEKAGADQWKRLLTIEQHELPYNSAARAFSCCVRRIRDEKKQCHGKYRPPDDGDLEFLTHELNFWGQKLQSAAHQAFTAKDKRTVFAHFMEQQQRDRAAQSANAQTIIRADLEMVQKNKVFSI